MKKFIIFILMIVITLGIWLYLSKTTNSPDSKGNNNDDQIIIDISQDIQEANIYESNGFDKKSLDLIISYTDEENVELLKNIIKSVKKLEGIVKMSDPDYSLEIIYEDNSKDQLYVWIMEDGISSIMDIEDTHTLYNFPEDMNEKLIDLFKIELINNI